MLTTINKRLACKPFDKNEVKSTVSHGLAMLDHLVKLEKTEVVLPYLPSDGTNGVSAGVIVYLPGDAVKQKWAAEIFTHEGLPFILVPIDMVVAFEDVR